MKVAVLGALGSIGARHAKNLSDLGHEVHIHDELLPCSAREYVIEDADAVVIATPTRCHCQDLLDCLEAGKPTFVEKPIAANEQEYDELVDTLAVHDVFVGYNGRFHPCVTRARDQLAKGMLGRPLYGTFVCAQLSQHPDYLRDGVILNWSHEIDLARYLLGPCELFAAVVHLNVPIAPHDDRGRDDMSDLFMVHGGEIRSAVHLNYLTHPRARSFQLVGTGGALTVDLVRGIITCEGQQTHFGPGQDLWDRTYIDEMQAFIAYAEGWKEAPGARGSDGLAVLSLCLDARHMANLP